MSKYNGRRDIESQLNLEDRNEGRMLNIIFKRFKLFINNSLKENIFILNLILQLESLSMHIGSTLREGNSNSIIDEKSLVSILSEIKSNMGSITSRTELPSIRKLKIPKPQTNLKDEEIKKVLPGSKKPKQKS